MIEIQTDTQTTVYEKTGLTLGETYYWAVSGEDEAVISDTFSFSTTEGYIQLLSPEDEEVLPENNSSVTLSWESNLSEFDIYLGTASDNLIEIQTDIQTKEYEKTGLTLGETYYWAVSGENEAVISDTFSFSTQSSAPAKIVLGGYRSYVPNVAYDNTNVDYSVITHLLFEYETYDSGALSENWQISGEWGLLATAQTNNVKLIVTILEDNDDEINAIIADENSRTTFIDALKTYYNTNNVDGFNIHFQRSGNTATAENRTNFSSLINEMRADFDTSIGSDFIISVSDLSVRVHPDWTGISNYNWNEFVDVIDFAVLMPFALGEWPTTETNANVDYNDFVSEMSIMKDSISKEKLVFGVATYGLEWANAVSAALGVSASATASIKDYDGWSQYVTYHTIVDSIDGGNFTISWDETSKTPFIYNSTSQMFISYDDSVSIGHKMDEIIDNDLVGVYIRSLDADVFDGKEYPLVKYIYSRMNE